MYCSFLHLMVCAENELTWLLNKAFFSTNLLGQSPEMEYCLFRSTGYGANWTTELFHYPTYCSAYYFMNINHWLFLLTHLFLFHASPKKTNSDTMWSVFCNKMIHMGFLTFSSMRERASSITSKTAPFRYATGSKSLTMYLCYLKPTWENPAWQGILQWLKRMWLVGSWWYVSLCPFIEDSNQHHLNSETCYERFASGTSLVLVNLKPTFW